MNRGSSEMLHCLNVDSENTEMSVFERQHSRLKWQQEQLIQHQPVIYFNENDQVGGAFLGLNGDQGLCEWVVNGAMKPDPGLENGSGDYFQRLLSFGNGPNFQMNYALPRTASCPPSVPADIGKEPALMSSAAGSESSKKRKADRTQYLKAVAEEKSGEKKMKGCAEEGSKMTELNSNNKSSSSTTTSAAASTAAKNKKTKTNSKENSKVSEAPKTDYIHVRARRGQATDSHSLAERVRREKISERMKYLQDLVPGCNKITGKAGMLDEIINYVQSLQRQVEFLSMKLAAINPRLDFNVEEYILKELFPACTSSVPTMGPSSSGLDNHGNLQFDALGQGVLNRSLEMLANPMDMALRRTISAPVSIPQTFLDSNIQQQVAWEDELQNLYSMEYQLGRASTSSFFTQPFPGFQESGHVKLEM